MVSVKLARGYAPDGYVSVLAVRGRVAGWRVWLADFARRWHLPWISREATAPTSLIDLAKPLYRFGIAKVRVELEDHRLGVKVATDAPSYAVRKIEHTSIAVTAPRGRTLPRGSEVAFAAVDEALLQLKDNSSWKLLETMMADRPLMVQTSTAQSQVVGKRYYGRKALAGGGGGGGGIEAGGTVRRDFQPLLLWRGSVPLYAAGHASLDAHLTTRCRASFRRGGDRRGRFVRHRADGGANDAGPADPRGHPAAGARGRPLCRHRAAAQHHREADAGDRERPCGSGGAGPAAC